MISTKPTRTVKLASGAAAMRSKMVSMTCGITPLGAPSVEKELPMVYVLPEPVCRSSRSTVSVSKRAPLRTEGYCNRAGREERSGRPVCENVLPCS